MGLRGSGIAVVTIAPGFIRSEMTARNTYPMPFLMPADRFARPARRMAVLAGLLLVAAVIAGCATTPAVPSGEGAGASRPPGGYYLGDGPGDRQAADLDGLAAQPDPMPIQEPLHSRANRPYRVLGNDYRPMTQRKPFLQRGVASWYGKKFHGRSTSIGERYDMYQMTAAHPTLPIPSFVRVTNLENGKHVVVRVNDRGPFLHDRAIDLSYLAAHKLGYLNAGSAKVEVELIDPARATLASASAPASALVSASFIPASSGEPATSAQPALLLEAQPTARPEAQPGAEPAGHYLQLGAFKARENAEATSRRLRRELEWLQTPIQVAPSGGIYRVQAGPYPLREQAARAGAQVESRTGLKPLLLAR